jgi:hypothetical protein
MTAHDHRCAVASVTMDRSATTTRTFAITITALALVVGACAGDDVGGDTTTTAAPVTTTAAPTTTPAPTTTTTSTTTAPTTAPTSTSAPPTTTTLPGEPIDIGPGEGDALVVAGVVFDDLLNVRDIPGLDGTIIDTLDPLAVGIVALGENRLLPTSIWYAVETGAVEGWASGRFLYFEGFTDDVTSEVVAALGEIPIGATVDDVGAAVALTRASDEPRSDITVAMAATTSGNLREIVIDVIGLGDDALGGERLRVFAEPLDGGGFALDTVERTLLCLRGVTTDGLCT